MFSGKTGAILFDITSPSNDSLPSFGAAVAGGKDLDRDGTPDFAIGAPLQSGLAGAAYVYSGKTGKLVTRLKPSMTQRFARFGAAIAQSDDTNGDRRADVIVGAPDQDVNGRGHAGEVFVFDGSRGRPLKSVTSAAPQANAGFGTAVTSATFSGNRIAVPVVGAAHQNANLDSPTGVIPHLEIGQIEIQP